MVSKVFFIFLFVSLEMYFINACEMDQTRQGCRIQDNKCSCGVGCISEYRYASRRECMSALKGRRRDNCFGRPCMNGGSCIQVSQDPGFKCRCEGTGYYGTRCDRVCPAPEQLVQSYLFPYECVVI